MSTNMLNYELLPKLTYLTLVGQDEDGELEFIGTEEAWEAARRLEEQLTS